MGHVALPPPRCARRNRLLHRDALRAWVGFVGAGDRAFAGGGRGDAGERPFGIDAWVVMPDHLHAVWTLPQGDADFSTRWGAIKARFTRSLRRVGFHPTDPRSAVGWNPTLRSASKEAKGDAGLWQRRYWEHHIRDEADYAAHVRYCWINPVKHGFVARAVDWPYSSIHRDIARGIAEPEWSGSVTEGHFGE